MNVKQMTNILHKMCKVDYLEIRGGKLVALCEGRAPATLTEKLEPHDTHVEHFSGNKNFMVQIPIW